MLKDATMSIRSLTRLGLAASIFAFVAAAGLSAQTSLPTRKPVVQVNLKVNEIYYLDAFKADIDKLESGVNAVSAQKVKLSSKDKLNIFLDQIDMMLFRQYCDREGIKVSESDINNQIAQYKASLGAGATDAMLEASLRRNGVFYDTRTYVKQDLLFSSYLRAKKADEVKAISQPSAADVLKAYDDMKFNLRRPSSYRFTMLLSRTQGMSDADKKKASDTMRAIAGKLKADPSLFDDYLAKGAVEPKTAGYQTMPGVYIAKTPESKKQYPALYDAVFQLKEGEVSDLIQDDTGLYIVRVSLYLPEKQLALDDTIEGLTTTRAAQINPMATVIQLVASELQNNKYAALQKSTRDAINAKLRKEGTVTVSLSALSEVLDPAEVDSVKALKGSGYSIILQ
jgi:parvulin-like peptidyl-prolyl isomerase